jgi:hypothetical protein
MKPLSFDAVEKTIRLFGYKYWDLSIVVAPNRDSFIGSRANDTDDAAVESLRDIVNVYPPETVFAVTFGQSKTSNGSSKSQAIVFSLNPAAEPQPTPGAVGLGAVQPLPASYVSREDLDAILRRNQEMTEHRVRIAQEEAELAKQRVTLQEEIKAFEKQKQDLDEERKKYQERYGHVKEAIDESASAAVPELIRTLQRMFTGGSDSGGKTLAGTEKEEPASEHDKAIDEIGGYIYQHYETPEKVYKLLNFIKMMEKGKSTDNQPTE